MSKLISLKERPAVEGDEGKHIWTMFGEAIILEVKSDRGRMDIEVLSNDLKEPIFNTTNDQAVNFWQKPIIISEDDWEAHKAVLTQSANECLQLRKEIKKYQQAMFEAGQDSRAQSEISCVAKLIEELRKDKSPGSYYYSWQSNIAMAIYDVLPSNLQNKHELCNKGAVNFLEMLIKPNVLICEVCGCDYDDRWDKCPKCAARIKIDERGE